MIGNTPKNNLYLPAQGECCWADQINANWEKIDTIVVGIGATYPPGAISMFPGSIPAGWLICDGRAVSRTTYAALFATIGTTYGVGDGSTTFAIPDLRGRFACGAGQDQALGTTGGANTVSLVADNMPAHTHTLTINKDGEHNHTISRRRYIDGVAASGRADFHTPAPPALIEGTTSAAGQHTHTGSVATTGSGTPHENRPPFLALHFAIRT